MESSYYLLGDPEIHEAYNRHHSIACGNHLVNVVWIHGKSTGIGAGRFWLSLAESYLNLFGSLFPQWTVMDRTIAVNSFNSQ